MRSPIAIHLLSIAAAALAGGEEPVSYSREVRPILADNCLLGDPLRKLVLYQTDEDVNTLMAVKDIGSIRLSW